MYIVLLCNMGSLRILLLNSQSFDITSRIQNRPTYLLVLILTKRSNEHPFILEIRFTISCPKFIFTFHDSDPLPEFLSSIRGRWEKEVRLVYFHLDLIGRTDIASATRLLRPHCFTFLDPEIPTIPRWYLGICLDVSTLSPRTNPKQSTTKVSQCRLELKLGLGVIFWTLVLFDWVDTGRF